MSTFEKAFNKAADNANYYKDRAASKIDEASHKIEREINKTDFERNCDKLGNDVKRAINPSFWDRNKETILVGSAIAAGSLIILLTLKK